MDKLSGGLADNIKSDQFDLDQLKKGINVEMEHTNDPKIALEIAKDHLSEDPQYYNKLETIEELDSPAMVPIGKTTFVADEPQQINSRDMAIFPGSFKPPHAGHYDIVKKLEQLKNPKGEFIIDEVHVVISRKAREACVGKRCAQVDANMSLALWELYTRSETRIKCYIADDPSPIQSVMRFMEEEVPEGAKLYLAKSSKDESDDRFNTFRDYSAKKGLGVQVRTVVFNEYAKEISSTDMRRHIATYNHEAFWGGLPDHLSRDEQEEAWLIATGQQDAYSITSVQGDPIDRRYDHKPRWMNESSEMELTDYINQKLANRGVKAAQKLMERVKKRDLINEISQGSIDQIKDFYKRTGRIITKGATSVYDFEAPFESFFENKKDLRKVIEYESNPLQETFLERLRELHKKIQDLDVEAEPFVRSLIDIIYHLSSFNYSISANNNFTLWTIEYPYTIPAGPKKGETIRKKINLKPEKFMRFLSKDKTLSDFMSKDQKYKKSFFDKFLEAFTDKMDIITDELSRFSASDSVIIITRAPVDVLRMSDFDGIRSCHSEGNSEFSCAMNESVSSGMIAYEVDKKNLINLFGENYAESPELIRGDEVFSDSTRDVKGLYPKARVRLRTLYDKDTMEHYSVPEKKIYGNETRAFREAVSFSVAESQKEQFKKLMDYAENYNGGLINLNSFVLKGGRYQDTPAGALLFHILRNYKRITGDKREIHTSGKVKMSDPVIQDENNLEELMDNLVNDADFSESHFYYEVDGDFEEQYITMNFSFSVDISEILDVGEVRVEDDELTWDVEEFMSDAISDETAHLEHGDVYSDGDYDYLNWDFNFSKTAMDIETAVEFYNNCREADSNFDAICLRFVKKVYEAGYLEFPEEYHKAKDISSKIFNDVSNFTVSFKDKLSDEVVDEPGIYAVSAFEMRIINSSDENQAFLVEQQIRNGLYSGLYNSIENAYNKVKELTLFPDYLEYGYKPFIAVKVELPRYLRYRANRNTNIQNLDINYLRNFAEPITIRVELSTDLQEENILALAGTLAFLDKNYEDYIAKPIKKMNQFWSAAHYAHIRKAFKDASDRGK